MPVANATHDRARFLRQAAQSVVDLFGAYGTDLHPATNAEAIEGIGDVAFLSVAGFVGAAFSGIVVLGTSESMLRRSNGTVSSSCDWMAELANQLLGRIKNRLAKEGVSIHRVPPAVMSGSAPSIFFARTSVKPLALTDDEDSVFLWVESEPSFEASDMAVPPDAGVLGEGEMILF